MAHTAAPRNVERPDATRLRAVAAGRVYDAECALHAAHSSHVDAWIAAAGDQLHSAIIDYRTVRGA